MCLDYYGSGNYGITRKDESLIDLLSKKTIMIHFGKHYDEPCEILKRTFKNIWKLYKIHKLSLTMIELILSQWVLTHSNRHFARFNPSLLCDTKSAEEVEVIVTEFLQRMGYSEDEIFTILRLLDKIVEWEY